MRDELVAARRAKATEWDEIFQRMPYVRGVHRVLADGGTYQLVCFSSRNGNAINHFTKVQLRRYFSPTSRLRVLMADTQLELVEQQVGEVELLLTELENATNLLEQT